MELLLKSCLLITKKNLNDKNRKNSIKYLYGYIWMPKSLPFYRIGQVLLTKRNLYDFRINSLKSGITSFYAKKTKILKYSLNIY